MKKVDNIKAVSNIKRGTKYTTWENVAEYATGILFMVVGIGVVWFLLASGIA